MEPGHWETPEQDTDRARGYLWITCYGFLNFPVLEMKSIVKARDFLPKPWPIRQYGLGIFCHFSNFMPTLSHAEDLPGDCHTSGLPLFVSRDKPAGPGLTFRCRSPEQESSSLLAAERAHIPLSPDEQGQRVADLWGASQAGPASPKLTYLLDRWGPAAETCFHQACVCV